MKKQRNLIILVSVILAAALGGILAQRILMEKKGIYAVVQAGGQEKIRLDLTRETEMIIEDENGYNLIRIEDGKVRVAEANCPDKICVKAGAKSKNGEIIACLPHKLIITVRAAGEKPEENDAAAW